jgi:hypothetical protein
MKWKILKKKKKSRTLSVVCCQLSVVIPFWPVRGLLVVGAALTVRCATTSHPHMALSLSLLFFTFTFTFYAFISSIRIEEMIDMLLFDVIHTPTGISLHSLVVAPVSLLTLPNLTKGP